MTAVAIEPEPVPLVRDQAGRLMVTGARISLDVLVADFYAIFAYYLRHRAEVDSYLSEQEHEGTAIQAQIESTDPPEGLRAKLLARLEP
jgi:hypothetical protein